MKTQEKRWRFGEVVENYIGGFHQCNLDEPVHLEIMSPNMCAMTGYTSEEISEVFNNIYTCCIHPEDVKGFREDLQMLMQKEGTHTWQYRLLRKDGRVMLVNDTMSSKRTDGVLRGYSAVTSLENLVLEDGRQVKEVQKKFGPYSIIVTEGHGIRRSEIIFYNDEASALLALDECDDETRTYYEDNLYRFFPLDYKGELEENYKKAFLNKESGKFKCVLARRNGETKNINCWLKLIKPGTKFEDSRYLVIFEEDKGSYVRAMQEEAEKRMDTFKQIYEHIYEVNLAEKTIKCTHTTNQFVSSQLLNLRFLLDDVKGWIMNKVIPEERTKVGDYFDELYKTGFESKDGDLYRIKVHLNKMDGDMETIVFTGYKISDTKVLICGQDVTRVEGVGSTTDGVDGNTKAQDGRTDINNRGNKIIHPKVKIITFGHFDVFVNGKPVLFRSEKAKELLAVLIDRRGGFLKSKDIITYLWPEDPANETVLARARKISFRLMRELKENGIEFIIEDIRGRKRIIPENVECDYFDFIEGKDIKEHHVIENYMMDYSWAEYTLGELYDDYM